MAVAKTASEVLTSTLKKTKKGFTVTQLMEKTGFSANTIRGFLSENAKIVGAVETGERGRPANIYTLKG